MWVRADLKRRAKLSMKRYYWGAVTACLILLILQFLTGTNSGSSASSSNSYTDDGIVYTEEYAADDIMGYLENYALYETGLGKFTSVMGTQVLMIGILLMILRIILSYFIVNPVIVGYSSFFYKNRFEKTSVGELAFAFNREDLFPVVKTMFLRELYIVLWTFLLIIPGLIKSYAYRMVPFILAEYPTMPAREALKLSEEMTNGHKWNIFVLDLSFFGWALLGIVTLGISDIFFTSPYMAATEAELYDVLKHPFTRSTAQADVF